MLKTLTLIFFILLQIPNEKYYIIHLRGEIVSKSTGKPLKIGDQLSSNEEIKFTSKDAVAVVIGSQRGRFTLKPSTITSTNGEFIFLVKSVILPLKTNGNLSTRGQNDNLVLDLHHYFGSDNFVIVGDKLSINFKNPKFPISEKAFFIYRYEVDGQVVSKKIESKNSELIFEKQSLYTYKDKAIATEKVNLVDIYYFNKETQTSEKIVSFKPLFISDESLMKELQLQAELFKKEGIPKEQILKELKSFVFDFYGNTDAFALENLISKLSFN